MDTEIKNPNMDAKRHWPAVLSLPVLKEYLGCGTRSTTTLRRRIEKLKEHGLRDKDKDLQGWTREEVDLALRRKRGLISCAPSVPPTLCERDDRAALVHAAKGSAHESDH